MKILNLTEFCCRRQGLVLLVLIVFAPASPIAASSPFQQESFSASAELSANNMEPSDDSELRLDNRSPKILVQSFVRVGNRGEEKLNVQIPQICGEPIWVFDHAEIEQAKNRFGGAQFVQLPQSGCAADCSPIVVRWYHEPTGHLVFGVRVYRRLTTLECTSTTTNEEVD